MSRCPCCAVSTVAGRVSSLRFYVSAVVAVAVVVSVVVRSLWAEGEAAEYGRSGPRSVCRAVRPPANRTDRQSAPVRISPMDQIRPMQQTAI